jgi:hypothetical protein
LCIDENFEAIRNISSVIEKFETCFVNWEVLNPTTTESTTIIPESTTTTEETTTLGGSRINFSMLIYFLAFGFIFMIY